MLTPKLEELIWQGKAVARTFTIGGSERHVLPVQKNSWIIIYDMIYFPRVPGRNVNDDPNWDINRLTQMNVFGRSQFNSFVIREEYRIMVDGGATRYGGTGTPFHINCYLPHDSDVIFTFSRGDTLTSLAVNVAASEEVSMAPPLDYGSAADAGAIATNVQTESIPLHQIFQGGKFFKRSAAGNIHAYEQLQYPVDPTLPILFPLQRQSMPIVQVSYVEISKSIPIFIKPGN